MYKINLIQNEHWILFALKDASQGYGFNIKKWFLEKPDDFDINNPEFVNLMDRLETEGILKRASKDPNNFYLSDKGKKELTKLKKKLKFKEYIHIISNFPEIELKERIKSLESFIILSIFLAVGSVVISGLSKLFLYYGNNIFYLMLFVFFFLGIAAYYVGNYLGNILLFWINDWQRETLWEYKEWFWDNQVIIKKIISGLFVIVIMLLFDYLQLSKLKDTFICCVE